MKDRSNGYHFFHTHRINIITLIQLPFPVIYHGLIFIPLRKIPLPWFEKVKIILGALLGIAIFLRRRNDIRHINIQPLSAANLFFRKKLVRPIMNDRLCSFPIYLRILLTPLYPDCRRYRKRNSGNLMRAGFKDSADRTAAGKISAEILSIINPAQTYIRLSLDRKSVV